MDPKRIKSGFNAHGSRPREIQRAKPSAVQGQHKNRMRRESAPRNRQCEHTIKLS